MPRLFLRLLLAFSLLAVGATPAFAQSTIKQPGQRTPYVFEAEPHLNLGLDPPGLGAGTGWGVGFRGTVEILKNGFIPKLNNSVGIGFGLDYLRYDGWQGARGQCERFETGPAGVPICVRVNGTGTNHVNYFFLPVVMQWNFWLHRKWSVFGEPGVTFYFEDSRLKFTPFALYAGGRYHITERIALAMRVGYPTFSLGVSFLL
jgi:hypothetical protein